MATLTIMATQTSGELFGGRFTFYGWCCKKLGQGKTLSVMVVHERLKNMLPGFVKAHTEISSYEGFLLTPNYLKRITRYYTVCVTIINGMIHIQLADNCQSTQRFSQQCLTLLSHVPVTTGIPDQ